MQSLTSLLGLMRCCWFADYQEEIEIEAKVLRIGKAIGVATVELRKKSSGKVIAQGRHTKYLAIAASKL